MKCEPVVTDAIAFHCQQAIEKYFKAFLIDNGWKLQKTHDLSNLYGEVKKIKDLQADEKVLSKLDDIYIASRYPDDYIEVPQEEAKKFYNFAKEIGEKIKKELGIK
jgi:HEPN domain-containing protein